MFERFTESARRTLFFARHEASQLGSLSIEAEHLLLGITRGGRAPTADILSGAGLVAEEMRALILATHGHRGPFERPLELPFSTSAKRVLDYAAEEASSLQHPHIGTEHLLLGMLRHAHGLAWDILKEKGLTLASVRDDLASHLTLTALPDTVTPQHIEAVRSVVTQILHAIDMRRWTVLPSLFTEVVITDYTTLFGGEAQRQYRDDLSDGWRQLLMVLDATQHLLGPIDVHLIGAFRADADCHVRAYHVWERATGGHEWMVAGHYLFDLEMNSAGTWQVSDLTLHMLYQTGNRNMLQEAGRVARG